MVDHVVPRVIALALAAGLVACADEDTVRVNEPSRPPPPYEAPPGGPPVSPPAPQAGAPLAQPSAGMMIHSASSPELCFDAKGNRAAPHAPVQVFRCHGRDNQRWALGPGPEGTTTITGIGGLCLDIHGAHSRDGASAQLFPCNGGGNQQFQVTLDGHLREVATGECLTAAGLANGSPVVVARCDPHDAGQVWAVGDR